MELMSGQLSWPPAFPLCSLTLVLSAHWLVDLSSSRRPPGQTSPVSAQWNQTEREGGLLRFLSSLSPCTLTLIFLRLCLHKELGHSATSAYLMRPRTSKTQTAHWLTTFHSASLPRDIVTSYCQYCL